MANLKLALVNSRRRERNVRERVDLIELQLAHRVIGSNGRAYNRAAQTSSAICVSSMVLCVPLVKVSCVIISNCGLSIFFHRLILAFVNP